MPIWDVTSVFADAGGGTLQNFFYGLTVSTICGWVRHNFDSRFVGSPHDFTDNTLTTMTDGVSTITRVGTYIDEGCPSWVASPPPNPNPPPPAAGSSTSAGSSGGSGASTAPSPPMPPGATAPPPGASPPPAAGGVGNGPTDSSGGTDSGDGGLGAGTTVLIVVLVILLLFCLTLAAMMYWRRRQEAAQATEEEGTQVAPSADEEAWEQQAKEAMAEDGSVATSEEVHVEMGTDVTKGGRVGAVGPVGAVGGETKQLKSSDVINSRVTRARRDNRAHGHAAMHKNSVLESDPARMARIRAAALRAGETAAERGSVAQPTVAEGEESEEEAAARARARHRASVVAAARANELRPSGYELHGEGATPDLSEESMPVEAHPVTETDDGGAGEGEQLVVVAARASFSSRESVGVAAAVPQWRARARARASVLAAARANNDGGDESGYSGTEESSRREEEAAPTP